MARVPKRNISSSLSDIRPPKSSSAATVAMPPPESFVDANVAKELLQQSLAAQQDAAPRRTPIAFFAVAAAFILLASATVLFTIRLQNPPRAAELLEESAADSGSIAKLLGFLKLGTGNLQDVAGLSGALLKEIDFLAQNSLSLPFNKRGGELVASLERVRDILAAIKTQQGQVAQSFAEAQLPFAALPSPDFGFEQAQSFVESLLAWLKAPQERHLVVLLQNTAEMRPTGGFWGSFAYVTMRGADVIDISVHDINEVDRTFALNIAPPVPLQLIEKRWHIANANWFFNFPDSASRALQFFDASRFAQERGAPLDAAIAVSPRVVADILSVTGPLELSGQRLIDQDNFLAQIQEEVQAQQARKDPAPKEILRQLTPLLLEKLQALDDRQRLLLLSKAEEWARRKDVLLYFRDSQLQNFFDTYGLAGRTFELPSAFAGDYVAVVGSTIDGGKSDSFITQTLKFQSQLSQDGTLNNHVSITRMHKGDASSAWWYKVPNKSFVQIVTPPEAEIIGAGGWETPPRIPAPAGQLARDVILAQIESTLQTSAKFPNISTFEQDGKNVFGAWAKVASGQSKEFFLDYIRHPSLRVKDGQEYEFVFERQSGVQGSYSFEIGAPPGYRWRENRNAMYQYSSDDPPGRLVVKLTLEEVL